MSWATAAAPNTAWFISSTERARPGKFRFRHLEHIEHNTGYLVLAMVSLDQVQSKHYREQIIQLIVVSG